MNEELEALRMDIHKKYCELIENDTSTQKMLDEILDLIGAMREEMKSLRTDVDKLIENNGGCYGRTA